MVPGDRAISNCSEREGISGACGAESPRWSAKRMQAYGDAAESIRNYAAELVADMCRRLVDGGAPGLHFYTLNLSKPVSSVLRHLE